MTITSVLGCMALGSTALAATAVSAQDSGFYAGVDVGVASYPGETRLQVGDLSFKGVGESESERFTWGVSTGYRFSKYFAAEVGYVDLGEIRATLQDASGNNAAQGGLRFSAKGLTTSAIGTIPLGKWEPFARVGLLFPDVDLSVNGFAGGSLFNVRGESNAAKVYWGLGVGYRFTDQWLLKAEANSYGDVGKQGSTGTADIVTFRLGFTYRF